MIRRKASLLLIIFLGLLIILSPNAFSQEYGPSGPEGDIEDWTIVESSYSTIYIDRDIELRSVRRRIDVSFARYDPVEKRLFLERGISEEGQLANKIDIIVRKAKKILDMHPQGFHVNIRIYETEDDLWNIYEEIFRERKDHKAYYIHKFQTVYISLDNVSESILAHEIGHSIIDNYFAILPPDKIRELLACYVDVHLKD
jgi:hypothetical protein